MAVILLIGAGSRLWQCPQFDGLDDMGYLQAAREVAWDPETAGSASLFGLRTGMSHGLGWLLRHDWLQPSQFWVLTIGADLVTMGALFFALKRLFSPAAGLLASFLYSVYPLAITQSTMYMPSAFQVAAISLALAFFVFTDDRRRWVSAFLGFLAGAFLGLGYLFKEDVALLVPAMAGVALLSRFRRPWTIAFFCLGAFTLFFAEGMYYLQTQGDFFYRLLRTSGQGEQVAGDLYISQIWQWHAYLRCLWLMPYQVGFFWWVGAASFFAAILRPSSATRFLAGVFLLLCVYLQFGSGSLSNYSPLPKSPRYTSIVTPFLVGLLGWWLADLWQRRHQLFSGVLIALLILGGVPCIFWQSLSRNERTRNTLALAGVLQKEKWGPVYCDYYSARLLNNLVPRDLQVKPWFHADFPGRKFYYFVGKNELQGEYVLIDRQACKVYTSSYNMPLPVDVVKPPASWVKIWTGEAYPEHGIERSVLESLKALATAFPSNQISERIVRNVDDMIQGDDATLYFVPPQKNP